MSSGVIDSIRDFINAKKLEGTFYPGKKLPSYSA